VEMEDLDLAAARTLETDEQALLASSGLAAARQVRPRRALRARV
jgi:hypothetical protein